MSTGEWDKSTHPQRMRHPQPRTFPVRSLEESRAAEHCSRLHRNVPRRAPSLSGSVPRPNCSITISASRTSASCHRPPRVRPSSCALTATASPFRRNASGSSTSTGTRPPSAGAPGRPHPGQSRQGQKPPPLPDEDGAAQEEAARQRAWARKSQQGKRTSGRALPQRVQ